MQILFISEPIQIQRFLRGMQAEATLSWQSTEDPASDGSVAPVTVFCAGSSQPYEGIITAVSSGYEHLHGKGNWPGVSIHVMQTGHPGTHEGYSGYPPAFHD